MEKENKEEKKEEEKIKLEIIDEEEIIDEKEEIDLKEESDIEEEPIFIKETEIDEEINIEVKDISIAKFTEHTNCIYSIDVNPSNSKMFVTGGGDDKAFIWKYEEKVEKLYELSGHKETVSNVSFNFDGSLVATSDESGIVKIWTVKDGKLLHSLEGPSESILWLQWHKKGNMLLFGSEDTTSWMFNAELGKCINVYSGHQDSVLCGTFTSNGNKILTGSSDCTIKVWDPINGTNLHTFKPEDLNKSPIHCIQSKPDDHQIFLAGTSTGISILGSIKTNKVVGQVGEVKESSIEAIDFFENGFATGGTDGVINIWDSGNLKLRATMRHEDGIMKLKFDKNNKILYSCSADNTVALWDIKNGEQIKSLTGHTDNVWDFVVTNDYLVTCSDDKTSKIFKLN